MSNAKILICDDEESIRESLKAIIGDYYPLIICESPETTLYTLAQDKSIHLALIDIKMPKINGLDLLATIKKEHPKVKVIVVTGYKSVEIAAEATRLGANGYIVKPFKGEEILEKIKKII